MFPHTAHVESMAVFEWDPQWKPSERTAVAITEETGTEESASAAGAETGDASSP
jgi:hypothetical protein